jgi:hypothetical protein
VKPGGAAGRTPASSAWYLDQAVGLSLNTMAASVNTFYLALFCGTYNKYYY